MSASKFKIMKQTAVAKRSDLIEATEKVKELTSYEVIKRHPAIKGLFPKRNPNTREIALITATISIMQDRVIKLLSDTNKRQFDELKDQRKDFKELSQGFFFALTLGIREAWRTPLVWDNENSHKSTYKNESSDNANSGQKEQPQIAQILNRFLNWGNFMTVLTVIMSAIAIYYTHETTNYESIANNRLNTITELKNDVNSLEKTRGEQIDQINTMKQKIEKLENVITQKEAIIMEKDKSYASLERNSNTSNNNFSILKNQNDKLLSENSGLKADNKILTNNLAKMKDDRDGWKHRYEENEKDIQKQNKIISEYQAKKQSKKNRSNSKK